MFHRYFVAINHALKGIRYRFDKNAARFIVLEHKTFKIDPTSSRLVFFAHYDPQDHLDPYVVYYISELYRVGSTIIFVSGSSKLSKLTCQPIIRFCAGIYTRETLSLDFGSWHLAWNIFLRTGGDLRSYKQLVLANDSVYGPLFDINEIFVASQASDLYGATSSCEPAPLSKDGNEIEAYIQSYFIIFNLNLKAIKFVEAFWHDFRYVVRKSKLIAKYEIGLSRKAQDEKLTIAAYASNAKVVEVVRQTKNHQFHEIAGNVNNTLYFWDLLIERFHLPFLKTDIPKRNRYGSRRLEQLPTFLRKYTNYSPEYIENHLARLGIYFPPSKSLLDNLQEVNLSEELPDAAAGNL